MSMQRAISADRQIAVDQAKAALSRALFVAGLLTTAPVVVALEELMKALIAQEKDS